MEIRHNMADKKLVPGGGWGGCGCGGGFSLSLRIGLSRSKIGKINLQSTPCMGVIVYNCAIL